MYRRLLIAVFVLTVLGSPAIASGQVVPENTSISFAAAGAVNALAQPAREAEEQFGRIEFPRPVVVNRPRIGSKALMTSLYATTATMQMLDVDSTLKSLRRGAIETNPLMSGLVKNRTAFVVTKASIAAATIYATSKIAKNNKVGAVLTLVAINSAYAMIVKHNYAIANR